MTLTEKWKKGELEIGWYYVKGEKMYEGIAIHWIAYPIHATEKRCIQEVLAPVPSFEEWQAKNEENKNLYKMLDVLNGHLDSLLKEDNENQQLHQLLKECKEFFEEENPKDFTVISERMDDLLTKINAAIGESEE